MRSRTGSGVVGAATRSVHNRSAKRRPAPKERSTRLDVDRAVGQLFTCTHPEQTGDTVIELKKDVIGIGHDVRMSAVADREGNGVEHREVTRGAPQWR
jgi:hypothetical protein